jgi:hypothetical protein
MSPLAGGDAWPGDAAASASAVEDYSAPTRVTAAASASARRPAAEGQQGASQARWLARPENHDYFLGLVHLARCQAWRARHPGYWRTASKDVALPQAVDPVGKIGVFVRTPLQDLLTAQPAVLIGLIAHLVGTPHKKTSSAPPTVCYVSAKTFSPCRGARPHRRPDRGGQS